MLVMRKCAKKAMEQVARGEYLTADQAIQHFIAPSYPVPAREIIFFITKKTK